MNRKVFFQTSIVWQLFCFMTLASLLVVTIVAIEYIIGIIGTSLSESVTSEIEFVLYLLAIVFSLKVFVKLEYNNIYFDSYRIYMNEDLNRNSSRVQFYSEIIYEDIKSIDIIWSKNNSKGEKIKSRSIFSLNEKPYLSITKYNNQVVNFLITHISRRSVFKLIKEMERRMIICGSIRIIESIEKIVLKLDKKTGNNNI